jgi:NADPH-dependent 2,4-dienoyl-CoA reductase/sulfur reductase-like enzyme
MRTVVIAGASTAGLSAARELRNCGYDGRIQVIDADTDTPYRRPEVSKGLLDGALDATRVRTPWPDDLGLERLLGVRLEHLDLGARTVRVRDDGETSLIPYDGLVIATGAVAHAGPFDTRVRGVHTLRTMQDAHLMRRDLELAQRIVIVGGGFIGLEVASVVRSHGKSVTVLETADIPLAQVLGTDFGLHVSRMHTERGVILRTGVRVAGIDSGGSGAVAGVRLRDGTRLEADLVLVAIGSKPGVDWLESSGLDLANGVGCDENCAPAGASDVVAAGDVASWFNPLYDARMRIEHWTNAIEQGAYAARRLLGKHEPGGFSSAPYFWSDQLGLRLQSIGWARGY